jgi:hypothetical protein
MQFYVLFHWATLKKTEHFSQINKKVERRPAADEQGIFI